MPAPPPPRRSLPPLGRFWTVANGLSLARVVLVAPIAWLVYENDPEQRALMFGLILLGIATDWLDGKVARWSNTVSEWGRVLDPTADKLAAGFVGLALVLRGALPVWFVALVIARDVALAAGGVVQARRLGYVATSLWSGKVAVGCLALVVLGALLDLDQPLLDGLIGITAAAMAWSLVRYGVRFTHVMRYGPDTPLDEKDRLVRGALVPPPDPPRPKAPSDPSRAAEPLP